MKLWFKRNSKFNELLSDLDASLKKFDYDEIKTYDDFLNLEASILKKNNSIEVEKNICMVKWKL